MKDKWDKLKTISDIIKDNKVLVLMALTALSSGLTNLGQMIYGEEKDILINAMADQITVMAPKQTRVIISSDCDGCIQRIETIEKKVNQLKRWH